MQKKGGAIGNIQPGSRWRKIHEKRDRIQDTQAVQDTEVNMHGSMQVTGQRRQAKGYIGQHCNQRA
jgi:hypothetical protein